MNRTKVLDKNSSKRVTSIARKVSSHFAFRQLKKFLFLDMLFIVIIIFLWGYNLEIGSFGEISSGYRHIDFGNRMDKITYEVSLDNGEYLEKDVTNEFYRFSTTMGVLVIFEIFGVIIEKAKGYYYVSSKLKPLNDIADTANKISTMAFDEEKLQTIEDIILNISPTESEGIHIKDDELKGIEDSINKLLERIRDTYREQARFVSDASHELRTPIAVIEGYANMLDRWGKDDASVLEESISAIKTEANSMKNLVEQLLFLARGINGKTKVNLSRFCLSDMINEVYEESMMIDEKHVYKIIRANKIFVTGDKQLLKQVARILVENAKKYTPDNNIIILKVFFNNNKEPAFSVSDSGIGIAYDDVSHIFERFFRADSARDRKTGGTGLGLSIAKWIIDKHKGYFGVLSREDVGTKIIVNLPRIFDQDFGEANNTKLDLNKN